MGQIQVVTSNSIERGLIPTTNMFDTENFEGLLRVNEKSITVKFFTYNSAKKEYILYTKTDNCTIDKRYVYTGQAGIIWFKLCFPLSYIRNKKKENLYAGGQVNISKCRRVYKNIKIGEKLDDKINPMEMFIINRKDDCLEIYPLYQFSKNTWMLLPQKYIDMVVDYYQKNITVFYTNNKTKIDANLTANSEKWIAFNDDIDILLNGGWYVLKNNGPIKEYYFGKAEYMSNRIKWQDGKIGHPQNNPMKIEPLFDVYNCWYFAFDSLKAIYEKINCGQLIEEVHTEVLRLILGLIKSILEFIVKDMGCDISFNIISDNCEIKDNNHALSTEDMIAEFFNSYISLVTSNIADMNDVDDVGKPHYVFNKYCTSWQKGSNKPENVAGICIIKDKKRLFSEYGSIVSRSGFET